MSESLSKLFDRSIRSVRDCLIDLQRYGEDDKALKALLDNCEKIINRYESDDVRKDRVRRKI